MERSGWAGPVVGGISESKSSKLDLVCGAYWRHKRMCLPLRYSVLYSLSGPPSVILSADFRLL